MQIKELARATGVDIETIRFYEKQGLWPEPARRGNGYRDYAPLHLERLAFIRHCRALDIPLPDVRRLLDAMDAPQAACVDVDELVDAQLARVRARLLSMQARRMARPAPAIDAALQAWRAAQACKAVCACERACSTR